MNEERFDDLTRREREALEGLRDGAELPPALEDRVVGELRRRGLVKRSGLAWFTGLGPVPRLAVGLGALAIAFGLGVQYGKGSAPEAQESVVEQPAIPEEYPEGAEVLAVARDVTGKPDPELLAVGGYDDFPPYPLDGESREISTKSW